MIKNIIAGSLFQTTSFYFYNDLEIRNSSDYINGTFNVNPELYNTSIDLDSLKLLPNYIYLIIGFISGSISSTNTLSLNTAIKDPDKAYYLSRNGTSYGTMNAGGGIYYLALVKTIQETDIYLQTYVHLNATYRYEYSLISILLK